MKLIKNTIAILFLSLLTMTVFGQEEPPQPPETQTVQTNAVDVQIQPKKEGAIRIGVVLPKAQLAQDDAAQDLGEPIRQSLITLMTAPTVELVPIEARIHATIKIEAEQKGCDFVLYSIVSRKQQSSIFGSLIKIVVPAISSTLTEPSGNAVQGDEGLKQNAQSAAQNLANGVAASIKAKDVFAFEFKLTTADGYLIKSGKHD